MFTRKVTGDHGNCVLTRLQFVEYDQRAHKLVALASFSFWVDSKPIRISEEFFGIY